MRAQLGAARRSPELSSSARSGPRRHVPDHAPASTSRSPTSQLTSAPAATYASSPGHHTSNQHDTVAEPACSPEARTQQRLSREALGVDRGSAHADEVYFRALAR
jgi:hypothetical protein